MKLKIGGKGLEEIKRFSLIAMIIMMIASFTGIFGLNIGGISVIVGVIFFFINKSIEKQTFRDSGLDIKEIRENLKDRRIWFWIILPLIMDVVCIVVSKIFLPEYLEHVLIRTDGFLAFDKLVLLIFQLAILAIGEEIAWRAFFQNQLSRVLSIMPALLITSVLFALGHLTEGNIVIAIYDVMFIFINSIIYGNVFHKTNNAWISAIAHFIANVFSIILLLIF